MCDQDPSPPSWRNGEEDANFDDAIAPPLSESNRPVAFHGACELMCLA